MDIKKIITIIVCAILCMGMCACGNSVSGEDVANDLNSNEDISALLSSGTFVYREDLSDSEKIVLEFTDGDTKMDISDGANTISEIVGCLGLDKNSQENTGKPISFGSEKELWKLIIKHFEILSEQYSEETGKTIRLIVTSEKDGEEFEVLAVENGEVVVNEYEDIV